MGAAERIECDVVVVGAGVIGLAIGARLSQKSSVVLVESFPQFGRETSSRNSEVVHSGIYYPRNSKKTEWCIRGRELLYAFCAEHQVPHAKVGKFVVSTKPEEDAYLDKLSAHCSDLKVPHERVAGELVMAKEPLIKVRNAVFLPETGIVNSHALMAVLEKQLTTNGGIAAYRHRVLSVEKEGGHWLTKVQTPDGMLELLSPAVVNAAGLGAAELSNATLKTTRYEHRYCRGRYFGLSAKYQGKFRGLVYPVPPKDGLGIHVTVDLDGFARLGPDVEWSDLKRYEQVSALYDCDWESLRSPFTEATRRYCPQVQPGELSPALIGVRPKLFMDGVAAPDFLVESQGGFIHCLGIESPGLTSSLAIADRVAELAS